MTYTLSHAGIGSLAAGPGHPISTMASLIFERIAIHAANPAFQQPSSSERVVHLDEMKRSPRGTFSIAPGEAVMIVGHGRPGRLANYDAPEVSFHLSRIKNIHQASFIYFSSCFSAAKDERGRSTIRTVAENLAHARARPGRLTEISPDDPIRDSPPIFGSLGVVFDDLNNFNGDLLLTSRAWDNNLHAILDCMYDTLAELTREGVPPRIDGEPAIDWGARLAASSPFQAERRLNMILTRQNPSNTETTALLREVTNRWADATRERDEGKASLFRTTRHFVLEMMKPQANSMFSRTHCGEYGFVDFNGRPARYWDLMHLAATAAPPSQR